MQWKRSFLTATALLVLNSIQCCRLGAETASPTTAVEKANIERVERKLESIHIDLCTVPPNDLSASLAYLTKRSKELDPEHIGVKFVLEDRYPIPSQPRREVENWADVALINLLQNFCWSTHHTYKIEGESVVVFPSPSYQTPASRRTMKKLQTIIIDKFNPETFDIGEFIAFLNERSKKLDPEHLGVKIVLQGAYTRPTLPPPAGNQPIHREGSGIENVPLGDALGYYCAGTGHNYKIEDDGAVTVFPMPPQK
jgi:hypothetical protein